MNSAIGGGQPPADDGPAAQNYLSRIEAYAHRIRGCREIDEIVQLLNEALRETAALNRSEAFEHAGQRIAEAQRQIETLKAELQQAIDLMLVDPLTGALNRRGLERAYLQECSRCDRHGLVLTVAVIDLDDFKRVNDRFGHAFGDQALRQLCEVMRATLRQSDVVCRFGGEEFVVVFPHCDSNQAKSALQRLQRALGALPVNYQGESVTLSFSAGLASRLAGESQQDLIARADTALLNAKTAGKNRIALAA